MLQVIIDRNFSLSLASDEGILTKQVYLIQIIENFL